MDGYSIFGRYLDSTAPGQSVPLDDCGGHSHAGGPTEYHYHAQLLEASGPDGSFVAYIAGPYNCWKGDIAKVTNFWDTSAKPTATTGYGAQRLTSRSDYAQIQPCCGTSQYYAVDGITITGTTAAQPSPTPSPTPEVSPPPVKRSPPPPKKKPPPPSKKKSPPPPKKRPPPSRSPKNNNNDSRRQFLPIDQ
jgi:hypothetical protein